MRKMFLVLISSKTEIEKTVHCTNFAIPSRKLELLVEHMLGVL